MAYSKRQGRPLDQIRPLQVVVGFHKFAEGSALISTGDTRVLVTASVDEGVPDFMAGRGRGWLTADYQMHPRANPKRREKRDGRERPLGGRTREIQRLIGRSLRAAVDLDALGERTVVVDCDVLEADGGTRTASVTGAFIALAQAVHELGRQKVLTRRVLRDPIAAVSVGHVDGELALDLCYAEDSTARVDLNLVATERGAIVEIQGTAEGVAVPREEIDQMVDLGLGGIAQLSKVQRAVLAEVGIQVDDLVQAPRD